MDRLGRGCEWYEEQDLPVCPDYGFDEYRVGEMGPASDHCCYCKDPTVSHSCIIVLNEDVI